MSDSDTPDSSTPSRPDPTSPAKSKRRRRRRRKRGQTRNLNTPEDQRVTETPITEVVDATHPPIAPLAESKHRKSRRARTHTKRKTSDQNHESRQKQTQGRGQKRHGRGQQDHALSAEDKLRRAVELINSVAREEAIDLGVLRLSTLHLNLKVGDGETTSARPSTEQINREVDALKQQINSQVRALVPTQFQRGTIYCFHRNEGINPPTIDAIFTGYDPLGRPLWTSFLPLCLTTQLPNIYQLYADPPQAIGMLMHAPIGSLPIPEVTHGKVYEVLAQLVVGPISVQFRPLRSDEVRHTLTAQVILVRLPESPLQVRFNLLGLDPDDLFDAAARSAPRAPISRARNCISTARRSVRRLQEQLTRGKVIQAHLAQESVRILEDLRDALLRSISGDQQRTRHAQRRHQSMERPTSEAWRDAARAGDERLFWDQHQETIVVVGPKSRVHIFSEDGRHVTSMRLGVGELERKRGQRRWRILAPDLAQRFRAQVRNRAR